jgi:predicted ester cyclase
MSVEENIALVRRLYEAFDEGKLNAFSEYVDSTFVASVLGTTTLDWVSFEEFADVFRSAFPDGRHVFDHVVADAENVVTIGSYHGTQTGPINGIAATNLKLELPVMHLDRVINGRIVEHRGLANEHDFMQQLGVNDNR